MHLSNRSPASGVQVRFGLRSFMVQGVWETSSLEVLVIFAEWNRGILVLYGSGEPYSHLSTDSNVFLQRQNEVACMLSCATCLLWAITILTCVMKIDSVVWAIALISNETGLILD